ncbi:MAG: hypothetical protein A2381_12550 [Bdellovibrionales bacterium RIFOXYB1_FULL_37_110]|nr:MAG: hypothetical protein A2181_07275 [Bdellovibrionales bacterium RIFOXYA1_FULL_38_20]OFZ51514.1 MAG: hypothetical protein A2417_12235 [Bdellovibrionales bacterium RIFOXYC1_FULL_37_79]OFZ60348.1 MAG: hypothetical protein A2381_12550 [Bdellovibrionales bacterium RIFOXYB1_FULL_37_110]OFZ63838.1 MAG: hypothetical protein A2577_05465 [Bdellovibrionales bacterium RIFOXYD1_FULL_36_51]
MSDHLIKAPLVFNVFKPVNLSSYDVIRHFKKNLPQGFGKIGHFGTLDPFACGVLLIGINQATKINNIIHDTFSKTYIAVGKLGVKTPTGDLTVNPTEIDESKYLFEEIKRLPINFLESEFAKVFLGDYLQSPHAYSASKYDGRPLHEWARAGVVIKKEQVKRSISFIQVLKYSFPWLAFRVTVSSGTFVRSLFEDMAKHLGTYGSLKALVRESIGPSHLSNSLKKNKWPVLGDKNILQCGKSMSEVLPLPEIMLDSVTAKKYQNGIPFSIENDNRNNQKIWVKNNNQVMGMGEIIDGYCKVVFNIS